MPGERRNSPYGDKDIVVTDKQHRDRSRSYSRSPPRGRAKSRSISRSPPRHRDRSRSLSRSLSRRRSRSRESRYSYSDYSDSFYSNDSQETRKKTPKTSSHRNIASKSSNVYSNKSVKAPVKKKPMGGKKGQPAGRGSKAGGPMSPRQLEYVTKRMLSARRIKINELRNEVELLTNQIEQMKGENKTLKRAQYLREKALDKFESQENGMSELLHKHTSEMRVAKDSFRKYKEKSQNLERHLRDTEDELERTKKALRKMKALADDKELGERDELARKLSKAESILDEKDRRVRDLDRHVDNLQKNHKHEMGIERARHKETQKKLNNIENEMDNLREKLRERDKELEVRNIYAARLAAKPPHHLNSSFSGSATATASRERKNSEPTLTGKDKAKMYAEKRREEDKRKREERERRETEIKRRREHEEREARERREREERDEREMRESLDRDERERQGADVKRERDEREWRERKERERREREERERREKDEGEAKKRREEEEEERKWREERDRRKREAEELFGKQKNEKRERERKQKEEKERLEREERQRKESQELARIEKEEIERRAEAERRRMDQDAEELERQQQKQALLAKMRALDEEKSKANKDSDIFSLSKDKTLTKDSHDNLLNSRHRKDYSFTKPTENMHQGKPAYDAGPEQKKKAFGLFDDSDSDGGYKPSFGRRGETSAKQHSKATSSSSNSPGNSASAKRTKKKDLMADLFGGGNSAKSTHKKTENIDFNFTTVSNNKATTRTRGVLSEGFGGGLGAESTPKSNSALLPRRLKQPSTTIHNRPTVNAIDDFDDDIEEVIL